MTDRKMTCAACKSAITKGDIAGSDLEFGGELKATDQPTYAADMDTNFIATVGMLDEYTPMVRTTGNQTIAGEKTLSNTLILGGYESMKMVRGYGAPSMKGNDTATQIICNQYINSNDDGNWMIRTTIFQSANNKGYSRILYLRRYDDDNNVMQAMFNFTIDANGKGHISVTDNDGTSHTVI